MADDGTEAAKKLRRYSRVPLSPGGVKEGENIELPVLRLRAPGAAKILVASDAMTRGMDVDIINNVVNYDAPVYVKTYVHRRVTHACLPPCMHCSLPLP